MGFVIGELLVIKGYILLVFVKFFRLMERVGIFIDGLIIVFYIVFVDGDDFNELIVDVVRGILDGYIVLLRYLVYKNYYLVIDVLNSVSRFMS